MFGRMAFSPNGRILALLLGCNSDVRLIAIPGEHELATLDTGPPLCLSGDGNLLATTDGNLQSVFLCNLRLILQELTGGVAGL